MRLRHQLPVYSPVAVGAVGAAAAATLGLASNARQAFADLLRREYAAGDVLLCGSGTQALQVAIESARREIGNAAVVALPSFSCFDVASAAVGARGPVALYDVDPLSLSPDLDSLERVFTAGARIVVAASLYGIPVNWDEIEQRAAAHGAVIIEDAAQGHGASYQGRALGTLGQVSVLSFGRGKGWTGGAGGAVLFRDGKGSRMQLPPAPFSRNLGIAATLTAQWVLGRPALYGLPRAIPGLSLGETVYHAPRTPASMSRAAVAAALSTRAKSVHEASQRRANAEGLRNVLAENPALRPVAPRPGFRFESGFLRFPILAPHGLRGFGDQDAARRLGIAASYPLPLGELPEVARLLVGDLHWPGAKRLVSELVTLPVHSLGSQDDRVRLFAQIRAYGRR